MLIPVFKAGSPAAIAAGITAADLPDIAAFDCANNPVPNVIGHPLTNSPANGAVMRFEARGDTLFADVPEKLAAFKPVIDGIKGGSILNRSMAFFGRNHLSNPTPGKIAPMHLGWLGGAAPGVAGLPPLASYFAASARIASFSRVPSCAICSIYVRNRTESSFSAADLPNLPCGAEV